jgi:hypothetical protein
MKRISIINSLGCQLNSVEAPTYSFAMKLLQNEIGGWDNLRDGDKITCENETDEDEGE